MIFLDFVVILVPFLAHFWLIFGPFFGFFFWLVTNDNKTFVRRKQDCNSDKWKTLKPVQDKKSLIHNWGHESRCMRT